MNVGELFVSLGFETDTTKLKDFAKAIGNIPLDAAAAVVALAGIEFELTKIAQEAMNTAVGFQMFTTQTGLSWQELQRWQIAAQQVNVSADDVAQSVSALERNMAEIRLGRGNIAPFQLLGVSLQQNAFGVITQLRERIRGLDRATATNLVTQMGLTPSMMQVLNLTNDQFLRLSQTVRGMTGDQEGSFLRVKQNLVQFGLAAKYVGFDIVDHLIFGFGLLTEKLAAVKGALLAIGLVAAGLAAVFFPLTASLVALVLVLDDLSVYAKGGHSVFGEAMEGLKNVAGKIIGNNPSPTTRMLGGWASVLPALPMGILPMMAQKAFGAASTVVNQTNNINVHSTAPAHQVAKEVHDAIKTSTGNAVAQTNNQGH